jgi:heat shock protein HslJ
MVPPAPAPLVGTNWTLDSFYPADAVSSVMAGTTITAVFDGDGSVTGSAGCNRYFASYTVTATSISIGTAGSTKMYCTSDGVMLQESTYLASLGRATTFTLAGDRLTLTDANGAKLLSFIRES